MTEEEFWQVVAELGGEVAEPAFDRLAARLAAGPVHEIVAFGTQLDRVLRRLDQVELWSQRVWDSEDDRSVDPPPLDAAGFLDARAAVVCAGRDRYLAVLADPSAFAGVWDFAGEMLLYVPVEAYETSTGQQWPYPLPGTDKAAATDVPVSAPPVSAADEDTGSIRLDVSAEAYRLVDVVATYDVEPMEGILAEPSPRTALPPGMEVGQWPDWVTERAFGVAATRISQVMRQHGGLAALGMQRLWVVLVLAQHWDLTLLLRPFSGAVHVSSAAVQGWTYEQGERAVCALMAHVVIEVARDYRVSLEAFQELRQIRDAGADLVPFGATTD
ncbi:DUF4240 domain-containing protein [Fodinicola feengrottensis]|uniref:DUF4240 domain-containing protein n=1 Tax=Fodinicola feengrottensis TaxID=435914 RepID=A0ABP4T0L9_9ACTN|nr:DUF4240 domain-containing protein [Fodinicola feengrottensis]